MQLQNLLLKHGFELVHSWRSHTSFVCTKKARLFSLFVYAKLWIAASQYQITRTLVLSLE